MTSTAKKLTTKPIEPVEYLRRVRPKGPYHLVALKPNGGAVVSRMCADIHKAEQFNRQQVATGAQVFVHINPLKGAPPKGKARKDDVAAVEIIGLDIDPPSDLNGAGAGGAGAGGDLGGGGLDAWRQEQVEKLLNSGEAPFAIFNSGRGIHAMWKLHKSVSVARGDAIAKAINRFFEADRGAWGSDRIWRVIGNDNPKAVPVLATGVLHADWDRTVPIETLEDKFGAGVEDADVGDVGGAGAGAEASEGAEGVGGADGAGGAEAGEGEWFEGQEEVDPEEVFQRLPRHIRSRLDTPEIDTDKGRVDRSAELYWIVKHMLELGFHISEAYVAIDAYCAAAREKWQAHEIRHEVKRVYDKWVEAGCPRNHGPDFGLGPGYVDEKIVGGVDKLLDNVRARHAREARVEDDVAGAEDADGVGGNVGGAGAEGDKGRAQRGHRRQLTRSEYFDKLAEDDPRRPEHGGFAFEADIEVATADHRIKNVLPHKGQGFLVGQSMAGKTTAAVDLAVACAAKDQSFAGLPVRERCGVIYLATEAGIEDAKHKINASKIARGIDPKEKLPIIMAEYDEDLRFEKNMDRLISQVERLNRYALQPEFSFNAGVIIIDTTTGAFKFEVEPGNAEAKRAAEELRRLANVTSTAAIGIGHTGKDVTRGHAGPAQWKAAAEFQWMIVCEPDELGGQTDNHWLSVTKMRGGPAGHKCAFDRVPQLLDVDKYGEEFYDNAPVWDADRPWHEFPDPDGGGGKKRQRQTDSEGDEPARPKAPKGNTALRQAIKIVLDRGDPDDLKHKEIGGREVVGCSKNAIWIAFQNLYESDSGTNSNAALNRAIGTLQKRKEIYVECDSKKGAMDGYLYRLKEDA